MKRVTHVAYDLVHRASSVLIEVKDLAALRAALARAVRGRHRVLVRAAGLSLDAQALGADVTLALDPEGFGEIGPVRVARGRATVRLGAMARWGDVFDVIAAQGYVTPNAVTGSGITVGGSLSSDCLSRFSGAWGKEVEAVESVEVVTADGALHVARPDAPEGSLARRLFAGVVGGFGALGVIVAATYRLRRVSSRRPFARTVLDTFEPGDFTWEGFLDRVRDETLAARRVVRARGAKAWREPLPPRTYDAVSATVWLRRRGPRGLLIRSRHVTKAGRSNVPLYQGVTAFRTWVEYQLAKSSLAADVAQTWNKLYASARPTSVDDLRGFTFFMDGNAAARTYAREEKDRALTSHQQTFVLPDDAAVAFAEAVERALTPAHATIVDVLYLPADATPVLLSPTRALGGFAITLGYQTLDGARLAAARSTLKRLSHLCARLGGRVSLVKNVYVAAEDLAAMYGDGIAAMRALKREVDPRGRFGGPFTDRLLGEGGQRRKKSARADGAEAPARQASASRTRETSSVAPSSTRRRSTPS